jgi:hypothetical protein
MGALLIIRVFTRLIILLLALIVIRRSWEFLTQQPSLPKGRARLLPPMGLMVGAVVLVGLLRSCIAFRV